jgi:GH24 family phage-related lysozyme (muramidase)
MSVKSFFSKHKGAEEKVAEGVAVGVGVGIIKQVLKATGVFAAGIASAAVFNVATANGPTYHPAYVLTQQGAAFIERHEGVRYFPYNDPSGKPICTVGVGHVLHYSACTSAELHRYYTKPQVNTLLLHDAAWAQRCIQQRLTHYINQAQFDALVDLAFNAGCGSLDYSGIANEINRGDLDAVPGTLRHTATTAGGRFLPGLATRRNDEAVLFATRYYGSGLGYYLPPKPPKPGPLAKLGRCEGIEVPRAHKAAIIKAIRARQTTCRAK